SSYEGIAMVQNDAARLNRIVVDAFLRNGERAISVQPSSAVVTKNSKIVRWDTEAVKNMLSNRLLPVPYGDVAMDAANGCSIISTEEIFSYLARALGAKRIILVGKVDGVLDSSGKVVPVISRKNFSDVKGCLQGSDGADVTGGMLHKVEMMLELVGSGIRSEVINGLVAGNLERALLGKDVLKTEIR
ncbi:MAG: isopentenyl phosphate kinase, partial [archaeon]|nr:isopentenyl phosphate kinase [archaeon]